ncbi:MAG TPA: ATP-binding protein [Catalimonadaceae bacterium]|nr:ATP-binding protein [Catalimonadaceae bacterium]
MEFSGFLFVLVLVAFLSLIPIGLAIFFVVLNRKNYNKFLYESEILRQQVQNQLLMSKVEIQESTFRFISREIHDNIGQVLSILKMNVKIASSRYEDSILKDAEMQLGKVIGDLRNLNKSFDPAHVLKDGFVKAIENEVTQIEKTGALHARFECIGSGELDKGENEVILFRMIQECIHNVIKHSSAESLLVSILFEPEKVRFCITDDGVGFDPDTIEKKGMGLVSLSERARLLNAGLDIQSAKGKGTTVTISVQNE